MSEISNLALNIAAVRERIVAAANRSGRSASDITLVAVTKKHSASVVRAAFEAGISDVGENFVQEAIAKQQVVANLRWHMLGHLQSNKARMAVNAFYLIQSVDSVHLARAIGRSAQIANTTQDILLQVHLGCETTKFGIQPEFAQDACKEICEIPHLALKGVMGIAPGGEEPRPYFRMLREISEKMDIADMPIVSMGMSNDFETAIEEGSTMIRIGTALFGSRSTH